MQPGQDGSFVYLIDENSKVKVQPVKIVAAARRRGRHRDRASKAGDQVITEIPQALTPGATVQLAGEGKGGGKGEKGKGKGGKKAKARATGKADGEGSRQG